jgi:adenosylhomocysteine nucleosidase
VIEERQRPGLVIAATGLRAEARIAACIPEVCAVAGGGNSEHLERLIAQAISQGGRAIISFGIAAGLEPGRDAGTCLVASAVVHRGVRYPANAAWSARLRESIGKPDLATVAGVDRPLQSPAEKHALHLETGAAAADMESHVVAQMAAKHGLPFAVLRVVADPAEQAVPRAAVAGMGKGGSIDLWAVLVSLALAPGQLKALMRVAADTRRARAELLRCRDLLRPGFGFRDLG